MITLASWQRYDTLSTANTRPILADQSHQANIPAASHRLNCQRDSFEVYKGSAKRRPAESENPISKRSRHEGSNTGASSVTEMTKAADAAVLPTRIGQVGSNQSSSSAVLQAPTNQSASNNKEQAESYLDQTRRMIQAVEQDFRAAAQHVLLDIWEDIAISKVG
jgi:hypothetical protein